MSSIIKVDTIQLADGTAGTIENLGLATGALSHRNLIINGAMQVAQRGTTVTGVTTAGYKTCDRFQIDLFNLGTWTVDQSTDAPNGFSNSLKVTCTTADASPADSDRAKIRQLIEAQSLQHLAFGTSDAKSLTLSFWVKSNKTGSATIALMQDDSGYKQLTPSYTINSANTWEYKTVSFVGDTSGTINNDNGVGLRLEWQLNSGSGYTSGTNQTTWTAYADGDRNASNLGVGGATSDYFAITGVQLEVGSVATPFEHRSYGEELARCQRYFIKYYGNENVGYGSFRFSTTAYIGIDLPTFMRTPPSVSSSGTLGVFNSGYYGGGADSISSFSVATSRYDQVVLQINGSGYPTDLRMTNLWLSTSSDTLTFDAEL